MSAHRRGFRPIALPSVPLHLQRALRDSRSLRVLGLLVALWAFASAARAETLVIEAERLHPVASAPIEDARVVVRDGVIIAVGPGAEVAVPDGARVLRSAVVTPGLIDAHTSAGLSGLRNVDEVLDQDESSGPDQADLRVIDAFDPRAPLLVTLRNHGVTLIQASPGPRSPIAGQAGIFRTHGRSADEMAVRTPSAMVFNLGEIPKATFKEQKAFPSTRMGTAALIRRRFHAVIARDASWFPAWAEPADPGLDALAGVAAGRVPALFVAHRADDLLTAIRIGQEFGLDVRIVGASEAQLVLPELIAANVPLIAGPVMDRNTTPERENASYETAAKLAEAGILLALRSGFEGYVPRNRIVLFEAAVAVANGLSEEAALRALTLDAARILGVADRYGSIEVGKQADLVLFDGDPFEYTSHIEAVVATGEVVHERPR